MSQVRILHKADVPCIDLIACQEEGGRAKQVELVRRSLAELGFLVLQRSLISPETMERCYAVGKEFFQLPLEEKLKIDHRNVVQKEYGDAGYYAYLTETAVNAKQADLKEFFHLGPLIDSSHPMSPYFPINPWPASPPEFRNLFETLYKQIMDSASLVLELVGEAAGMDTKDLRDLSTDGKHILRMLHYPAVENALANKGAIRAAPHTGINLIGLQLPASHEGLQFCTPAGEWVALDAELQPLTTVNIGELLAMQKPEALRPTLHQVVNPQQAGDQSSRWAIVFFFVPNPLKDITVQEEPSSAPRTVRAGELLLERFRQIGTRMARADS